MMGGSEGWGWGWGMGWGIDGFGWIGLLVVCLIVVVITFFALRRRNPWPTFRANEVREPTITRRGAS